MTSKYDQNVLELGRLVASEFKKAAGHKRPVDAHGIRMKDGQVFVAATNDRSSAVGPVTAQLRKVYGAAADDLERLVDQRDFAISITGRMTTLRGGAQDRIVTINGKVDPQAWDAFTR